LLNTERDLWFLLTFNNIREIENIPVQL